MESLGEDREIILVLEEEMKTSIAVVLVVL